MLFYKIDDEKLVRTTKLEGSMNFVVCEIDEVELIDYIESHDVQLIKYLVEETKEGLIPKLEIHENLVYIYLYDIDTRTLSKGALYEVIVHKEMLIVFCENYKKFEDEVLNYIIAKAPTHMTKDKLLIGLFNYILKDDMGLYRLLEETIADLEVDILDKPVDANTDIILLKKQLINLKHYYEQFVEIAWDLEENKNNIFSDEGIILLKNFTRKLERINSRVATLKDYITQVREAYQAQVDIRLNATMETFTVITAIFLPLTLLTSWYGMNFVSIKEFGWKYGYYYVMAAAIFIAVTMWLYFKKKNMFR